MKHAHPRRRPELWLDLAQNAGALSVTLSDDGPGLPAGFDPDAARGLGMQICLIYARQMGGGLDHGASERGGARFRGTVMLDAAASS